MRNVAVTEGDKVGVQEVLGWEVNTWPVGTLVEYINAVTEVEVDSLIKEYAEKYNFATDNLEAVRYQAKEEIAMKKMLDEHGCKAYTNTFEDLYGMEQLPGLGVSNTECLHQSGRRRRSSPPAADPENSW